MALLPGSLRSGAAGRVLRHGPDLLLLIWALLAAVALAVAFGGHGYDDPYITYRYAANLASGQGFVYNVGERVLSTTTPLYALLLAGGALLGLDIPFASNLIGCVGLAASSLMLWRLGLVWSSPLAGAVAALLYPTFPHLIYTLGAETILYLALILGGLLAAANKRYAAMALLLALATLTRADGVLAAAVVGAALLLEGFEGAGGWNGAALRERLLRLPWHAALMYAALLVPWFAFAWAYFGTPLPATLAAKQQQGLMEMSSSFAAGLGTTTRTYWHTTLQGVPLYRLHAALATVGLFAAVGLRCWRPWLLLVGWNALYVVAYSALGVTSYFWYYAPLVVGLVVLVGLGVAAICRMVQGAAGWAGPFAGLLAGSLLVALLLTPQLDGLATWQQAGGDQRLPIYRTVGTWLQRHTPTSASVATLEVGIIGYYAQRRMIDFAGLLQPAVAARLAPTATYGDTARWAIRRYRPDYVVLHGAGFPQVQRDPAFVRRCRPVARFAQAPYPQPLVVYACTW